MNHAITIGGLLSVVAFAAGCVLTAFGVVATDPRAETDAMGLGCLSLMVGIPLLVWALA